MTDLLHDIDAPSDAELISRVRGGDVAAYGELFSRHVEAARRLARQLVRGPDADDLVSDAFAKVLGVLQGGGGPDVAFRAYLLTAVRRLHVDKIRAGSKLQTSDDMEAFDAGVPFQDTAGAAFESGAAAKAFASLPERWQLVLWHLEVEGQKPADIAPLLGMSANSVSALAYRAREGLRQAFLTMHLNDTSDTSCRWVNEHLGAYVRNGLAKRDAAKVQSHLDECRRCTAMYLELTEVNSNLRGIIAPLLLGAAAAGYLSSTGAAAGGGFSLVAMFGRAREAVTANAGAATAGAVAAGVAAVATAGILLLPSSGPEDSVTGADEPIGTVTTPGQPGDDSGPGEGPADREGTEDEAAEDEGTAASEEPALEATPESVPVGDTGTESTADGDPGSETDGTSAPGDGGAQPGTDEPGTDQPPGEQPPGEQPPGEQPPGEQPPGEQPPGEQPPGEQPPPTEEPPPPPPVQYTIQVTALRVEDGRVSFDFDGVLPPVVHLSITSGPAEVLFTDNGTCRIGVGGTTATCDLAGTDTGAQTLFEPLARIAAAVTEDPFLPDASVGLTTPTQDSDVTIAMRAVPGGPVLATGKFTVKAPVAGLKPDVGLTVVETQIEPTNVHDYLVSATLSKTDYDGGVAFVLSGDDRARFADVVPGCTRGSDTRIECDRIDAGPITLPLYVQDNREKLTNVTLGVEPITGLDTDPTNNSVALELEPFRPAADAAVSVTASQEQGNSGKATLQVGVSSSDPTAPMTVAGTFDPAFLDDRQPLPDACKAVESGVTCAGSHGDTFSFAVDVGRVQNTTRFENFGFTVSVPDTFLDPDTSNNSDSRQVERFGKDLVDSGSGGTSDAEATSDGLRPTATTSPVARTLEATAETLQSLAKDVTRAEKERTSVKPTVRATKPTEAAKISGKAARPAQEAQQRADRKADEAQERADRKAQAEQERADRKADAEQQRADRKADAEQQRADRKAAAADASTTSAPAEGDGGLVDTVVKAVKKLL